MGEARFWVNITAEAEAAIRAKAELPFRNNGERLADGTWDIPISITTFEGLIEVQLPGETLSDTIVRICAISTGRPQ